MEFPAIRRDTWPRRTRRGFAAASGNRRPARRGPSSSGTPQGPASVRGLSFSFSFLRRDERPVRRAAEDEVGLGAERLVAAALEVRLALLVGFQGGASVCFAVIRLVLRDGVAAC